MLEALAWYELRSVVGVFDNDKTGAEQFQSLRNAGFSNHMSDKHIRHRKGAVQSILIPTPPGRDAFAPEDVATRVLEMEHYYSDSVLHRFGVAGEGLYGSSVFKIRDQHKARFTQDVAALDASEFSSFRNLFDELTRVIGIIPTATADQGR